MMVVMFILMTTSVSAAKSDHIMKLGLVQVSPGGFTGYLDPSNLVEPALDAWEFVAATRLAVDVINNQTTLLPNHTIVLQWVNDDYDPGAGAILASLTLMDPVRNANPPSVIVGLVSSDIAATIANVAQVYNTPVVADFATASTLSDKASYPTFSRVCGSDITESAAILAIIRQYGWKRIAILSTNDASPAQTADSLAIFCARSGINVLVSRRIILPSNLGILDKDEPNLVANIREHLEVIKASEARIIVASVVSVAMHAVLRVAYNMSMLGPPYQWIGTAQWSFDADLLTDPLFVGPLTGLLSVQLYPSTEAAAASDQSTETYRFTHSWQKSYAANPNNTCNIPQPRISALRYDAVFLVAQAYQNYFEETSICNQTAAVWLANCSNSLVAERFIDDGYYATIMGRLNGIANRCCAMYLDDHQLFTPLIPLPSGYASHELRGYVMNYHIRHAKRDGGVSGPIELDYDTGDRLAHYSVVNARGPSYQDTDGLYRIGEFLVHDSNGNGTMTLTTSPIWPGNATTPPRDAPLEEYVVLEVPFGVKITFWNITIFVMCVVLFVLQLNWRYRHVKVIKMSSPHINSIILLGFLMVLTFVMLTGYTGPSFDFICNLRLWLVSLGFTLSFGGLFAKTYRVHKIFNSEKLKVHDKLQDKYLFKFVGGLVGFDLIVLTGWTVPDALTKRTTDFARYYEAAGDRMITERVESCSSDYFGQTVLIIYKAILLLFGAWLAFSVRNVAIPALNDSKQIGQAIYSVGLVGGLLILTGYLTSSNVTISYIVPAAGIDFLCLSILGQIFGSKMRALWKMDDAAMKAQTTPDKLHDSQSATEMTKKVRDLEHENAQLRQRLGMPARGAVGGSNVVVALGAPASPVIHSSPVTGRHGVASPVGLAATGGEVGTPSTTRKSVTTWAASRPNPAAAASPGVPTHGIRGESHGSSAGGSSAATSGPTTSSPGKNTHVPRPLAAMNHGASNGQQPRGSITGGAAGAADVPSLLPSGSSHAANDVPTLNYDTTPTIDDVTTNNHNAGIIDTVHIHSDGSVANSDHFGDAVSLTVTTTAPLPPPTISSAVTLPPLPPLLPPLPISPQASGPLPPSSPFSSPSAPLLLHSGPTSASPLGVNNAAIHTDAHSKLTFDPIPGALSRSSTNDDTV